MFGRDGPNVRFSDKDWNRNVFYRLSNWEYKYAISSETLDYFNWRGNKPWLLEVASRGRSEITIPCRLTTIRLSGNSMIQISRFDKKPCIAIVSKYKTKH